MKSKKSAQLIPSVHSSNYIPYILGAIFVVSLVIVADTIRTYSTPTTAEFPTPTITQSLQTSQIPTVSPTLDEVTPTEVSSEKSFFINKASNKQIQWKKYIIPELGLEFSYPTNFDVQSIGYGDNSGSLYYRIQNSTTSVTIFPETITPGYWDLLDTKASTHGGITVSPITYQIVGEKRASRYEIFGEGVPCSDNDNVSSDYLTQQHVWALGNGFHISLTRSWHTNNCNHKDDYEPTTADIATTKRIIESIKFVSYPVYPTITQTE